GRRRSRVLRALLDPGVRVRRQRRAVRDDALAEKSDAFARRTTPAISREGKEWLTRRQIAGRAGFAGGSRIVTVASAIVSSLPASEIFGGGITCSEPVSSSPRLAS